MLNEFDELQKLEIRVDKRQERSKELVDKRLDYLEKRVEQQNDRIWQLAYLFIFLLGLVIIFSLLMIKVVM